MFRPKIPTNPTPTGAVIPLPVEPTTIERRIPDQVPAPAVPVAAPPSVPARPTVQLTPGALLTVIGGGTAVVLVVGTVLVSMLLAVAVTASSVAVCALVLRSLMTNQNRR